MGRALMLLGLILSAHSELRARDPEVEQEHGSRSRGPGEAAPQSDVFQDSETQEGVPARSGNWCAVVQERVITTAVMSGTEEYTVKSYSHCPSGAPGCQLVMYKLSRRPVYKQAPRVVTALLWKCCPGHSGHNCEDSGIEEQLQHTDPHQEQQDQHGAGHYFSLNKSPNTPIHSHGSEHRPMSASAYRHGQTHQDSDTQRPTPQHTLSSWDQDLPRPALHYQDTPTVLPVPHMMALVMSQLQPVLESFNRSLMHIQSQVGALVLDVAELKSGSSPELQAWSRSGLEEKENRLEDVYQELREVQEQLQLQRHLMDSQHNNLTKLKTDMEKRAEKQENMLQVSVQALNLSLAEVKLDQKEPSLSQVSASSHTLSLWRAVQKLDDRVVNNTVKVETLEEDVDVTFNSVQQLHRLLQDQDKRINITSRRSQVHFMETGLEVEAAKVAVLRRVEELAGNVSLQGQRLSELDVDVDYLYTVHYKQNSSSNCGCSELQTVVSRLQTDLTNVTGLVNENRLALEESEVHGGVWGDADWRPAVEALEQELKQIKSSWALEQDQSRTVEQSLADLSWSLQQCRAEVSLLQQTESQRDEDNKHLRGSFNSLLKDAIRHSDVLELLLGEEVLEFLDSHPSDQEAYSIPTLKERLKHLEEQLGTHNRSITLLLKHQRGHEEGVVADQPSPHPGSEWLSGGHSNRRRWGPTQERQRLQLQDGSDLWNLERTVKKLQRRVHSLEKNLNDRRDHQSSSKEDQ